MGMTRGFRIAQDKFLPQSQGVRDAKHLGYAETQPEMQKGKHADFPMAVPLPPPHGSWRRLTCFALQAPLV